MPLILGLLLVAGLIAFVLFLPPLSLLRGEEDGGGGGGTTTIEGEVPQLPAGLEAVSPWYEIDLPDDDASRNATLRLRLSQQLEGPSNVNLYTYEDDQWRRVASAEVINDGSVVRSDGPLGTVPDNVIALRRIAFGLNIHGWLPPDATPSDDASQNLTVINPVSFAPDPDGGLRPLGNARNLGGQFRVVPTIRAQTPGEIENANTVLAEQDLRESHITEILFMVQTGNYDGVDIDYREIVDEGAFLRFISGLGEELRRQNKILTVTLPLPEVDDAGNVDTGNYDWNAISLAADYIKVMPERTQEEYRRVMEAVLRTTVQTVDPGKILLVISPYSAEQRGEDIILRRLGEALAVASAIEIQGSGEVQSGDSVNLVAPAISQDDGASGLYWSDDSLTVQFTWPGEDGNNTTWIENQYSAAFKLDLVRQFNLAGIALEDVGDDQLGADLWPAILPFLEDGAPTLLKPNPDLMQPYWEYDGGTIEETTYGAVTWTAPAVPGEYAVSLALSDGVVRMGTALTIDVQPRPGQATPTPEDEEPEESPTPRRRRTATPTP